MNRGALEQAKARRAGVAPPSERSEEARVFRQTTAAHRKARFPSFVRRSVDTPKSDSGGHEPGAAVFASSRDAAIRFWRVRKLMPNISAASCRLPHTCSSVSLM